MPTITDLTNYTWVGNPVVDTNDDGNWYNLNFISNNTSFTQFALDPNMDRDNIIWYSVGNGYDVCVYDNNTYPPKENGWSYEEYRTIFITGGTDATNATLISWLQTNGTLINLANTHWKLNNNITFTNVGTKSINFKSGNTNFSSITINTTDGLKYDNTTIVEAPAAYNVTVSFTNGVHTSKWDYTKVFDTYYVDSTDNAVYLYSSNVIGSLSSANGSATVTTTKNKLLVFARSKDVTNSGDETYTTSGGVVASRFSHGIVLDGDYVPSHEVTMSELTISDDGSVTINGVDWDF